jgi:hypothetical protein
MKKNKISLGLPGGPNEYITHISDFVSIEGYKRTSPDVNNPFNIIPSGNITMNDVDFPVIGTDNYNNQMLMMPGFDYEYPGDYVIEQPVRMANGGPTNPPIYVDSRNDPRYRAYNDSLNLYNTSQKAFKMASNNKSLQKINPDYPDVPVNFYFNKKDFLDFPDSYINPKFSGEYVSFEYPYNYWINEKRYDNLMGKYIDDAILKRQNFPMASHKVIMPSGKVAFKPQEAVHTNSSGEVERTRERNYIGSKLVKDSGWQTKKDTRKLNSTNAINFNLELDLYQKPTQPVKIKPKETERMLEATLPEVVVKPPVDYSNSGLHYSIGVDKGKIVYKAGSIGNMKTMTPQQFEQFKKTDEFKKYNEVRRNDTPALERMLTDPTAGYIKMQQGGFVQNNNNIDKIKDTPKPTIKRDEFLPLQSASYKLDKNGKIIYEDVFSFGNTRFNDFENNDKNQKIKIQVDPVNIDFNDVKGFVDYYKKMNSVLDKPNTTARAEDYIGKPFGYLPKNYVNDISEGYSPRSIWTSSMASLLEPENTDRAYRNLSDKYKFLFNQMIDEEGNFNDKFAFYFLNPPKDYKLNENNITKMDELNNQITTYLKNTIKNNEINPDVKFNFSDNINRTIGDPSHIFAISALKDKKIRDYLISEGIDPSSLLNNNVLNAMNDKYENAFGAYLKRADSNLQFQDANYGAIQHPEKMILSGYLEPSLELLEKYKELNSYEKNSEEYKKKDKEFLSYVAKKAGLSEEDMKDALIHFNHNKIDRYFTDFNLQQATDNQQKQFGGSIFENNNMLRAVSNNPSNNYYSSVAKSTIARENAFGNDAAKRMVKPTINPYDFGNGDFGTHYMSSMGNYAVPSIQKGADGNLFMNENASPYDKEAIRFNYDNEAEWFAKNYKSVSPALRYQTGGFVPENNPYDRFRTNTRDNTSYVNPNTQPRVLNTNEAKAQSEAFRLAEIQRQKDLKAVQDAEVKARMERIAKSEYAKTQPTFTENLAVIGDALSDKFRFSYEPNLFDDYLNPFVYLGDMAGALGNVPQNIKTSNYAGASSAIANPLLMGAMAGYSSELAGTGFVNELFNPGAGIGYNKPVTSRALNNSTSSADNVIDLWRIQEKGARPMSELAAEGKLGKHFQNEKAIKHFKDREEHFGQWFTKDKNDFDFYKNDREFINPEILNLKVPKAELEKYTNYNKSLSRAPDREFVVPLEDQKRFLQSSFADDVGKGLTNTPQPWQMQELSGLHLKSTMEGEAISKIVEPKTGLINTEQALSIIGKESGGADKVALIRQGLGDNVPKKMDYNEFRKVVQDQLIPLERELVDFRSNYGIDRIGYGKYKTVINERGNPILQPLKGKNLEPIENQTLILGNKSKFGRGSSAHGNPEETLGHAHFLRDAETPDVLTVTQIQSDAFQGPHRTLLKTKEQAKFNYDRQLEYYNKNTQGIKKLDDNTYQFLDGEKISKSAYDNMLLGLDESLFLSKADLENFTQKQLLDKNHQERYLQELVDYAGKRGDINKMRVPTSETAAKVQGYTKQRINTNPDYINPLPENATEAQKKAFDKYIDDLRNNRKVDYIKEDYSLQHQTILKKYSEQPKTIKKLFGKEPTTVTDGKGNTWYEFDVPEKFKQGKGEIKAFGLSPVIGIGAASGLYSQEQTPEKMQKGGFIPEQNPYDKFRYNTSDNTRFAQPQQRVLTKEEALKQSEAFKRAEVQRQKDVKSKQDAETASRIIGRADFNKAIQNPTTIDNLGVIGDELGNTFRAYPFEPDMFDDYINPGVQAGDMIGGLLRTPKNIREGNYGQVALDLAVPALTLAGARGARNVFGAANEMFNPVAGFGINNIGRSVNLSPARAALNNAQSYELDLLRQDYLARLTNSPDLNYPNLNTSNDVMEQIRNINYNINSNQLAPPPSEIRFTSDGSTIDIYNQPIMDYVSWEPTNKSGLRKKDVLKNVSDEQKDIVSKMTENEFVKTVLKPTGEIVPYDEVDLMSQFSGKNNIIPLSSEDYTNLFNSKIDLLNDIIAKNNKSGVQYKVKKLTPDGRLIFETPEQIIPNANRPVPQHYLDALNKIDEPDFLYKGFEDKFYFSNMNSPGFSSKEEAKKWITNVIEREKGTKINKGDSVWSVGITPGQWKGEVQDIANEKYLKGIPGLNIRISSDGVFPIDSNLRGIPGTGAYKSINDYLKTLDLGRVKPGFNSQSESVYDSAGKLVRAGSKDVWENFIKSNRAVGYYGKPNTVYGTMKNLLPYVAPTAIGLGIAKQQQPTEQYKKGGEAEFNFNVYRDYVNGVFDNTPKETEAKKIYDKLNNMYYRTAKENNTNPVNYIMTHLIGANKKVN